MMQTHQIILDQQQQHQERQTLTHQRLERQVSDTRMSSPPSKKSRGGHSLVGSVHVRAKSYRRMAEERWTSPLSDDEVTPEVKVQYDAIKDSILSIPWTSGVVAIRRYFQELISGIQMKAAIHPTLARVVARDMHHSSMLTLLCHKAHTPLAHPTMKFLIERNPSALLWKRDDWETMGIEYSMPIYTIANHHAHHVLLPWIAEYFPWVLEHPALQARPPTFDFIAQCINGIALNANIVRQFFAKYPQALSHVDPSQKSTPLHHFLSGFTECRLDLFQWLATKCPTALVQQNALGWTPLHAACLALTESPSKNMKEICKFIIQRAPQSVHMMALDGTLPIHILKNCHSKPNMQEIMLILLRTYPESHSMTTKNPASYPAPSSHQFVKKVMPLTLEERELQGTITHLRKMPANLTMALGGDNGQQVMISSVCKVFATWSKSKLTLSEGRLKAISTELGVICKAEEQAKDTSYQAIFSAPGATETEQEDTTDDDGEDLDYSSDDSCFA
mmetsp:Transcript_36811/g.89376  ORF Transcript_36811/g.89376 Transcript_36811/m.89376 type:complete len:505 (+) Transcript_36811:158-1672(+)